MNTPFLDDGRVDTDSIRRSVEAVVSAGVAGMLVLAVAGETGSLDMIEKRLVASTFLDQAAGRVPVIVGCSSAHHAQRLQLATMAHELNADAMLCQTPADMQGSALLAHMRELLQVGPTRLVVQDLDFNGSGMPLEDILLLHHALPGFTGVKIEVVLPGPKYSAVLDATAGALHVSGGWAAAQMMEALHRGVHAFIPTAMDAIYVAIHRRFHAGDVDGARALHARIAPVLAFSNQHIDISIRFFKHLRRREGVFTSAFCRDPVRPLDRHQTREMEAQLQNVLALQQELASPAIRT